MMEKPPKQPLEDTPPNNLEKQEAAKEKDKSVFDKEARAEEINAEYEQSAEKIQSYIEVVDETRDLTREGRPCKTKKEEIVAKHEELIKGLEGLADKYAQQDEPHKEKAVRAYIDKVRAEKTLAGLEFDFSEFEFGEFIRKELPFRGEIMEGVENSK